MTIFIGPQQTAFDWVNPTATMLAVLIGGLLTYWLTARLDSRKQHQQDLRIALGLMFKVQHLLDDIARINEHVREAQNHRGINSTNPLWLHMTELVGFSTEPPTLASNDLSLVAIMGDQELTMSLMGIESGHRIVMDLVQKINELKNDLSSAAPLVSANGNIFSFEFDPIAHPTAAIKAAQLRDASLQIEKMTPEILENASSVASNLGQNLKVHYKFKKFIALNIPSSDEPAD